MQGFLSPIPLPSRSEIPVDACVEPILLPADGAWTLNGEVLVDLGIFHIHEGIEHVGLGEACPAERCGEGMAREAHIPLGGAECRDGVLAQVFPDTPEGRAARADALLGCAQAVVGYAVCLDGTATSADLGALWPQMQGTRCYNFGGPTGGHAGHAAMVQWIHMRDVCESMTSDPALLTTAWEVGKVQVGVVAALEVPGEGGDLPLCGTVTQTSCADCGARHERCCGPEEAEGDACGLESGLECVAGRCWPDPSASECPPDPHETHE